MVALFTNFESDGLTQNQTARHHHLRRHRQYFPKILFFTTLFKLDLQGILHIILRVIREKAKRAALGPTVNKWSDYCFTTFLAFCVMSEKEKMRLCITNRLRLKHMQVNR